MRPLLYVAMAKGTFILPSSQDF